MTNPTFNSQITFGNLLTILVMVVGGVMAFTKVQAQQQAFNDRMIKLEVQQQTRATVVDNKIYVLDERVRASEIVQAGQSADLRSIQDGINEINLRLRQAFGNRIQERPDR